jgi:hypothetical protein
MADADAADTERQQCAAFCAIQRVTGPRLSPVLGLSKADVLPPPEGSNAFLTAIRKYSLRRKIKLQTAGRNNIFHSVRIRIGQAHRGLALSI